MPLDADDEVTHYSPPTTHYRSTAIPIAWYPLSTYTVVPVMPLASG